MLTKRIIPCLDVNHGRVVKGRQFKNLRDVDDPVALGKAYSDAGADELVFYDITATHENRPVFTETVKAIARKFPSLHRRRRHEDDRRLPRNAPCRG